MQGEPTGWHDDEIPSWMASPAFRADMPPDSGVPAPPLPTGTGIDWITQSFPITHFDRLKGEGDWKWYRQGKANRAARYQGYETSIPLPNTSKSALLTVHQVPKHSEKVYVGKLEYNPSWMVDTDEGDPCPIDLLGSHTNEVWSRVITKVEPGCSMNATSISRLDVALDLEASPTDFTSFITTAFHSPPGKATKNALFNRGHGVTGYEVGSGQGGLVRMYDRTAVGRMGSPYRVEIQAHGGKGWATDVEVVSTEPRETRHVPWYFRDITTDRVATLFHDRIKWAGLTSPVLSMDQWIDRVATITDDNGKPWSAAKINGLIGFELQRRLGKVRPISPTTKALYRSALAQCGLMGDEHGPEEVVLDLRRARIGPPMPALPTLSLRTTDVREMKRFRKAARALEDRLYRESLPKPTQAS